MNERDRMLRRVRGALTNAPIVPADATIQRSLSPDVDVTALLIDRLEDYRAIVINSGNAPAAAIENALRERGISSAVIDPMLDAELRPAIDLIEDHGLLPRELDAIPAAITTAWVAVADTGTIILTHAAGQGRRAISLVPDVHVCVLRRDQIVGTVPEAMAVLHSPAISTWISGPSATSDIELNRVEGVHGPRTLIVVLV